MRLVLLLAASATLVAAPLSLSAQDSEWNRYTLEGLGGVFVQAEAGDACLAAGIAVADLEGRATAALTDKVPLLSQREMLELPALPELRLTVECADEDDRIGFAAWVRLQQSALMVHDEQVTLPEAVTWWTSAVGVTSEGDAAARVGEAVDETMAEFAAAWEAANAEEGEPGR